MLAESRRQELMKQLGDTFFFSLFPDGSTASDEKVYTQSDYFATLHPQLVTTAGLFKVLESGLHFNEISADNRH